jgi:hypothetical protein
MYSILYKIVNVLNHVSPILPLGIYLLRNKGRLLSNQALLFYLVATFIYELITTFTEHFKILDHHIVNTYIVLEFVLLAFFYKKLFLNNSKKQIVNTAIVLFLIVVAYLFVYKLDYLKINETVKTTSALLMIGFSILYFVQLLQNFEAKSLLNNTNFWFVTGVFFYFCATFVFSMYSRQATWGEKETARNIYFVVMLFTVIFRVIISIGIWNIKIEEAKEKII